MRVGHRARDHLRKPTFSAQSLGHPQVPVRSDQIVAPVARENDDARLGRRQNRHAKVPIDTYFWTASHLI